jgi:hypothetical protein
LNDSEWPSAGQPSGPLRSIPCPVPLRIAYATLPATPYKPSFILPWKRRRAMFQMKRQPQFGMDESMKCRCPSFHNTRLHSNVVSVGDCRKMRGSYGARACGHLGKLPSATLSILTCRISMWQSVRRQSGSAWHHQRTEPIHAACACIS